MDSGSNSKAAAPTGTKLVLSGWADNRASTQKDAGVGSLLHATRENIRVKMNLGREDFSVEKIRVRCGEVVVDVWPQSVADYLLNRPPHAWAGATVFVCIFRGNLGPAKTGDLGSKPNVNPESKPATELKVTGWTKNWSSGKSDRGVGLLLNCMEIMVINQTNIGAESVVLKKVRITQTDELIVRVSPPKVHAFFVRLKSFTWAGVYINVTAAGGQQKAEQLLQAQEQQVAPRQQHLLEAVQAQQQLPRAANMQFHPGQIAQAQQHVPPTALSQQQQASQTAQMLQQVASQHAKTQEQQQPAQGGLQQPKAVHTLPHVVQQQPRAARQQQSQPAQQQGQVVMPLGQTVRQQQLANGSRKRQPTQKAHAQPSQNTSQTNLNQNLSHETRMIPWPILRPRYNRERRHLDLSALSTDQALRNVGLFQVPKSRTKDFLVLMRTLRTVFNTVAELHDRITSISLARNGIKDVQQVPDLDKTLPSLQRIDLANNDIHGTCNLGHWRRSLKYLWHINLNGNPIVRAEPAYRDTLPTVLPTLQTINGTEVGKPPPHPPAKMSTSSPQPPKTSKPTVQAPWNTPKKQSYGKASWQAPKLNAQGEAIYRNRSKGPQGATPQSPKQLTPSPAEQKLAATEKFLQGLAHMDMEMLSDDQEAILDSFAQRTLMIDDLCRYFLQHVDWDAKKAYELHEEHKDQLPFEAYVEI
ncbi:hypothetical protein K470DRAFT_295958 [Piedraia hortae CBS 480.64]|uniref:TAP-C domain-containing protein n=1 Tax=Piedraia hortae CBS 480.64 TaxID=1314780 RepID=A0A6A7BV98_9PEZI|nr:hypothetical protein K470DRAFT_295958 [Piedraia hortae CBS 480.64]